MYWPQFADFAIPKTKIISWEATSIFQFCHPKSQNTTFGSDPDCRILLFISRTKIRLSEAPPIFWFCFFFWLLKYSNLSTNGQEWKKSVVVSKLMSAGNLPNFFSWTYLIGAAEYKAESRADMIRADQTGTKQSRQDQRKTGPEQSRHLSSQQPK